MQPWHNKQSCEAPGCKSTFYFGGRHHCRQCGSSVCENHFRRPSCTTCIERVDAAPPANAQDAFSKLFDPALRVESTSTDFVAASGHRLHVTEWPSVSDRLDGASRGLVLLVHGHGEHMGRYQHVASYFCRKGYTVVGFDHFSMGKSENAPPRFSGVTGLFSSGVCDAKTAMTLLERLCFCSGLDLLGDLTSFVIDFLVAKYSHVAQHFVYAHSMGGALTILLLNRLIIEEQARRWPNFKTVLYSSPMFAIGGDDGISADDFSNGGSSKVRRSRASHTTPLNTTPHHTAPHRTTPHNTTQHNTTHHTPHTTHHHKNTTPLHTTAFHAMPCHAMLCSCNVTPCHAVPCHTCHAVLCHASCPAPLRAVSPHAIPFHPFPSHSSLSHAIPSLQQYPTSSHCYPILPYSRCGFCRDYSAIAVV